MNNNFFFPKICHLWDNVEKCSRAGQATDDNIAHARCMPDIQFCKYTLNIPSLLIFHYNNGSTNTTK